MFIGSQYHYHIGAFHRIGNGFDAQTAVLGFFRRFRTGAQSYGDIDPGFFKIIGVRVALRAVTDNGNFFTLN